MLNVWCTLTGPRFACPNRLRSLTTALVADATRHQSPWHTFPTGHWTLHRGKKQKQGDLRFIPTRKARQDNNSSQQEKSSGVMLITYMYSRWCLHGKYNTIEVCMNPTPRQAHYTVSSAWKNMLHLNTAIVFRGHASLGARKTQSVYTVAADH